MKWKIPLIIIAGTALGLVAILGFGDSQWGPPFYRFQTEWFPGSPPLPPEDFDGKWKTWDAEGRSVAQYADGKRHGTRQSWSRDNRLRSLNTYDNDHLKGHQMTFYDNGIIRDYCNETVHPLSGDRYKLGYEYRWSEDGWLQYAAQHHEKGADTVVSYVIFDRENNIDQTKSLKFEVITASAFMDKIGINPYE